MSDEKRTFEAHTHLLQSPRLQARRVKGKKHTQEPVPGIEMGEPLDHNSLPVTPDLILRLIKLLKDS